MPIWMCLLIGILAAVLDWSGVGPHAIRDRVAAIGYLASALGWFDQLGVASWELAMHRAAGHDARIIWSMAAVVPILFWIGAMVPAIPILGRFGKLTLRKGPGGGGETGGKFGKAAQSQDRINSWLLAWTVAVAASVPLTMPSAYRGIVDAITSTVTTTSLTVGRAVASFFGWA